MRARQARRREETDDAMKRLTAPVARAVCCYSLLTNFSYIVFLLGTRLVQHFISYSERVSSVIVHRESPFFDFIEFLRLTAMVQSPSSSSGDAQLIFMLALGWEHRATELW